jgi:thiamine pyrophosphate-dependent acetolactate synthase large subunit-like protein
VGRAEGSSFVRTDVFRWPAQGRRAGRIALQPHQGAEALGCYVEYVEEPEDIRLALQRAWKKVEEGTLGFVNVKIDYGARATAVRFSSRET